jgi:hypothetical protein
MIQNFLPAKQVSMATSQVFFWQYLGGSTFLAVGQTIFANSLRSSLRKNAPSVDANAIISAGAATIRTHVSKQDLPGVLRAYNVAIRSTFVRYSVFMADEN